MAEFYPLIKLSLFMYHTNLIQRNNWLITQYFEEVWNKGKVERLDDLLATDYVNHSSDVPNPLPGPEGLKPIVVAMRQAFPDLHYEIKDLVIASDRIVAMVLMKGTHEGDFFGLMPTNRRVKVNQVNFEYVTNGKISEHWRLTDELSLMKQLGLIAK
jgi:steroid delta-isomerase-like uncharacterized protein